MIKKNGGKISERRKTRFIETFGMKPKSEKISLCATMRLGQKQSMYVCMYVCRYLLGAEDVVGLEATTSNH